MFSLLDYCYRIGLHWSGCLLIALVSVFRLVVGASSGCKSQMLLLMVFGLHDQSGTLLCLIAIN